MKFVLSFPPLCDNLGLTWIRTSLPHSSSSKIRVTRPVRDPRRSGETEVVGIQTYLQDAFFASFKQLVDAVGDLEGVIGYEVRAIYPSLQAKPCAEP
jgi:hypothetical protein